MTTRRPPQGASPSRRDPGPEGRSRPPARTSRQPAGSCEARTPSSAVPLRALDQLNATTRELDRPRSGRVEHADRRRTGRRAIREANNLADRFRPRRQRSICSVMTERKLQDRWRGRPAARTVQPEAVPTFPSGSDQRAASGRVRRFDTLPPSRRIRSGAALRDVPGLSEVDLGVAQSFQHEEPVADCPSRLG